MNNKIKMLVAMTIVIAIVVVGFTYVDVGNDINFAGNSVFGIDIKDPSFDLKEMNTSRLQEFKNNGLNNYSITTNSITITFTKNNIVNMSAGIDNLIFMHNTLNYSISLNFTGNLMDKGIFYGYYLTSNKSITPLENSSYWYISDAQYPNGTLLIENSTSMPKIVNGGETELGIGVPILSNINISIPAHYNLYISLSSLPKVNKNTTITNDVTGITCVTGMSVVKETVSI